jgi:hypothetical protein
VSLANYGSRIYLGIGLCSLYGISPAIKDKHNYTVIEPIYERHYMFTKKVGIALFALFVSEYISLEANARLEIPSGGSINVGIAYLIP